jgi:hypothetical protein
MSMEPVVPCIFKKEKKMGKNRQDGLMDGNQ